MMTKRATGAALAAVGAGTVLLRRAVSRGSGLLTGGGGSGPGAAADRWHGVTVALPPDEVGAEPPGPLAALTGVEIRMQPAPGGKGTELHARLTGGPDEPRERQQELREALREAKQLLETGEVLAPTRPGSSEPTLLNAPLRWATAHGRSEGRL